MTRVLSAVGGDRTSGAAGDVRRSINATLVVAGLYVFWAARYLSRHSPADLGLVGRFWLAQGHGSSKTIDALAPHATGKVGYDGQFNLFLALDPRHAHRYIDEPAYRSSRILTSMLARVVGVGQPTAIPVALVVVNIAAVLAGTFGVALLLRRHGMSAWFALLYGCSPALFVAVDRDLNEPVAYAFVIGGMLMFDQRRMLPAAALLGLAGISRETTLLFPLALMIALLLGLGIERVGALRAWRFAAISFLPYIGLRLGLFLTLGRDPPPGPPREWIPFHGLYALRPLDNVTLEVVYSVVLPSLVALAVVWATTRRVTPTTLALTINVAGLVAFLPESSYRAFVHAGRITFGVVVATLCCAPLLPARVRVPLLGVLAVFWLAPWDFWFPYAFLS